MLGYEEKIPSPRRALYEDRRRHDRDTVEGVKGQQIGVAGDDQIRPAVDRQLEKFVVGRIAASRDALDDRNELGCSQQSAYALPQRRNRRCGYVRPGQHFQKLLLGCDGFGNPSCRSIHRTTKNGSELSLSAALTNTFVSTTSLIQHAARLPSAPA